MEWNGRERWRERWTRVHRGNLNWTEKNSLIFATNTCLRYLSLVYLCLLSLYVVCVYGYTYVCGYDVFHFERREREGGIATCRHLGPKNMKLSGSDFYPQKQQNYAAKLEPRIRTTDLHLTDLRHLDADTKYWSNILYTDENHEDRSIHSERACSADVKASVTINRRSYLMQSLADLTNLEACFAYWKW